MTQKKKWKGWKGWKKKLIRRSFGDHSHVLQWYSFGELAEELVKWAKPLYRHCSKVVRWKGREESPGSSWERSRWQYQLVVGMKELHWKEMGSRLAGQVSGRLPTRNNEPIFRTRLSRCTV